MSKLMLISSNISSDICYDTEKGYRGQIMRKYHTWMHLRNLDFIFKSGSGMSLDLTSNLASFFSYGYGALKNVLQTQSNEKLNDLPINIEYLSPQLHRCR